MVWIKGREETKPGCVVSIEEFGTLKKRVPRELSAMVLMRRVGRNKLLEMVNRTDPDQIACELFKKSLTDPPR